MPEPTRWERGRRLVLRGHARAETYSVLTRLPGAARLLPADAVALIDDRFEQGAVAPFPAQEEVHGILAERRIVGGAVDDGLVALAAREGGLPVATRDARARGTHEAFGVRVGIVA